MELGPEMPGKPGQAVRTCWLAILLVAGMAGGHAAEKPGEVSSEGGLGTQVSKAQGALAKIDLNFKPIKDSSFGFDSGDLRIAIKANKPTYYEGKPFQNSAPQSGVYGSVNVSDRFYGIERVFHYALSKGNSPYGGFEIQERITVLYENLLHRPLRPRAFDSKPFVIGKDGTFQDRQVMGHYDTPWPDNAMQILRQELVLDGELVAVIYIMRTKKEICILGYSVPPLMPNFLDSSALKIKTPDGKK